MQPDLAEPDVADAGLVRADLARTLRLAARGIGRHGLVHAYGHVSVRIDETKFLVSPPQPLCTVDTGDQGVVVTMNDPLPARALPEVRMHREIYRQQPQIGGICRFQSPAVIALSALGRTPRVLHGLGSYFSPSIPFWPDVQLVRDDARAVKVAELMGDCAAIVLRGNGAVTAGQSLEEAASFAFFLEDAARIELAVLSATTSDGCPLEYSFEETAQRATKAGALIERMWQFLCFGDPEWQR